MHHRSCSRVQPPLKRSSPRRVSSTTRPTRHTSISRRSAACSPPATKPYRTAASSFATSTAGGTSIIKTTISDPALFNRESSKVFESLLARLEAEDIDMKFDNDIEFSGDVLNVRTAHRGTWVLNKHGVTKQIWLSSPITGPSKYNYFPPNFNPETDSLREYTEPSAGSGGIWLDERTGENKLSDVLQNEWSEVFDQSIQFSHDF